MKKLSHQLSLFVLVGIGASIVHWLVVVALVSQASWAPLVANVIGWLIAFVVSFTGHYQLTTRPATPLRSKIPICPMNYCLG
jgi:putative flippase GtrA